MRKPLVTVVIPCYNHELYVQESIQGVIDQDYDNIELIVIDDGSKDASVSKIQEMVSACEERFTRFEFIHRENKGLCHTVNQALEWCRGDFFAPIASDDRWLPSKTSFQVAYLETHPTTLAVFGGIHMLDESGKLIRTIQRTGSFKFEEIFLHQHFLPAPTALIRSAELKKFGYDPSIKIEDWNTWLKLTHNTHSSLDVIPNVVAEYRRHDNNMSKNIQMMHQEGLKILSQFSSDKLYKRAVAEYMLALSAAIALYDKRNAFSYYCSYLKANQFSLRAIIVFCKILTPLSLYKRVYEFE
jgi:alpha-1,3-rhamnosyltransferase